MSAIYFGGSRHPQNISAAQVGAVVAAVVAGGNHVHVGCQFGADHQVILSAGLLPRPHNSPSKHMRVFAVAPTLATAPPSVQWANTRNIPITYSAGGTTAPMPARYLLRSIAAFTGCAAAVFFAPGSGSLAVARRALAAGIPVFIFAATQPALPVPAATGQFFGFSCWAYTPATQPALF